MQIEFEMVNHRPMGILAALRPHVTTNTDADAAEIANAAVGEESEDDFTMLFRSY